jgi:hypothetical protein
MRKWGIVVTAFYVLILAFLLLPAFILLVGGEPSPLPHLGEAVVRDLGSWDTWALLLAVAAGQVLLLFLSVDTSRKRLKPRTHLLTTTILTGLFLTILCFAAILSVVMALEGDNPKSVLGPIEFFGCLAFLWLFWGVLFYVYGRGSSDWVTKAASWLLRGSVLELLIAVPCHVIVRRRNDCSAPIATGFGIVTGIAIMLLSFGPSVLFLFKKRMDESAIRHSPSP